MDFNIVCYTFVIFYLIHVISMRKKVLVKNINGSLKRGFKFSKFITGWQPVLRCGKMFCYKVEIKNEKL